MSPTPQEVLLVEVHRIIADAAEAAVAALDGGAAGVEESLAYPPVGATGPHLSSAERQAVGTIELSAAVRAGLEKVIADACAATIFGLLALMDGVADPEVVAVDEWYGASLHAPDDHQEMLHDRFYESYWMYQELRAHRKPT